MIELGRITTHNGESTEKSCPDCQQRVSSSSPLDTCSSFSIMTMNFMSSLLALGYSRALVIEDIPKLPNEDSLQRVCDRFLNKLAVRRTIERCPTIFKPCHRRIALEGTDHFCDL